ncbi:MAG TPA: hypothetical protein VLN74_00720 [Ilumatobacteraceae bacterium]|nr:hypothetical protein [Ilumatobacteraceae bacterium]
MDANLEPDGTEPLHEEPLHVDDDGERDGEAVQNRSEPGAPSDNTTLTAILASLDDDGFGAQFVVREGAEIECLVCRNVSPASKFVARRSRRLEGASDPDDMVHVVAATCPVCDVGGTVVLTYGVNASLEDGDVSLALDMSDAVVEAPGMTSENDGGDSA